MNFFRRIIGRLRDFRKRYDFPTEYDAWEEVVYDRSNISIHRQEERHEYVKGCLEQIKDASLETDALRREYNIVTALLKDMEDIESLPADEAQALKAIAGRLSELRSVRAGHEHQKAPMDELEYGRIDALREEVESACAKLAGAEEYHAKVKQDMKHLVGEKEAYLFRKQELQRLTEDLKSLMVISLCAVGVCVILLLVLQFGFEMNTRIGYILTAGVAAVAITLIFLKHNDATHDLKRVEKSINKIILLHNSVKIRFVNNSNLLDYLRIKYGVRHSGELTKIYQDYLAEKARREALRQMEEALDSAERDIVRFLRHYKLYDPLIWVHQTAAILDRREMVEVRHKLIIRRQSLRRRMDYNNEVVAKKAQDEIKDLVEEYPRYAKEILAMVAEYEGKYSG